LIAGGAATGLATTGSVIGSSASGISYPSLGDFSKTMPNLQSST